MCRKHRLRSCWAALSSSHVLSLYLCVSSAAVSCLGGGVASALLCQRVVVMLQVREYIRFAGSSGCCRNRMRAGSECGA